MASAATDYCANLMPNRITEFLNHFSYDTFRAETEFLEEIITKIGINIRKQYAEDLHQRWLIQLEEEEAEAEEEENESDSLSDSD